MATGEQIKALLKSHLDGDNDRFYSVAMQIAAHEARSGHGELALGLRNLVDASKSRGGVVSSMRVSLPRDGLGSILEVTYPKSRVSDMVLNPELSEQLHRVIREQRHAAEIFQYGLTPRCKLLLIGPPGTGKTMTASVLAGELGLPLYLVRLDGLITRYMGETAAKLRQIFDAVIQVRGVYLFDEFDAIGSQRGIDNDVGEIRRIVNSFLLMIEQDDSRSLIVAATNYPRILDPALFRRFDDVLHYDLPDKSDIIGLLRARLGGIVEDNVRWDFLGAISVGLSHAEVVRATNEVVKHALIQNRTMVSEADIREMIEERIGISIKLRDVAK